MAGANVMVSWTSWTSLNCNVENDKRRWNDDDDDDSMRESNIQMNDVISRMLWQKTNPSIPNTHSIH